MSLRWLLFIEALIACLTYAQLTGPLMFRKGWALRVTLTGFGGILLYVTAVQIKAYQRDSPFDFYSWLGLISVTIYDIGVMWFLWDRRRRG